MSCTNNSTQEDENVVILGETFGLKGDDPKQFLYDIEEIIAVYGYDDNGNKINFSSNDYYEDLEKNTIARTVNYAMPNFDEYSVNFDENGTFTFNSEPRNPPLCRQFQIYVDYIAKENARAISPDHNSFFENKPNELPKIIVFGDSIANAAQTTALYFQGTDSDVFVGLLRTFLQTEYGSENVVVDNFSKTDMSIDLLVSGKEKVIKGGYNTVIIEYGMNDHLSDVEEGAFETKLQDGLYLFLYDFGRILPAKWDLEEPIYPAATLKYNKIVEKIAKNHNVPFVDIYNEFLKISWRKDLIEDLTVVWMHHPIDFGHSIYFSMLLPYFIKEAMPSNSVANWVLY